jgi:hypothetical protein
MEIKISFLKSGDQKTWETLFFLSRHFQQKKQKKKRKKMPTFGKISPRRKPRVRIGSSIFSPLSSKQQQHQALLFFSHVFSPTPSSKRSSSTKNDMAPKLFMCKSSTHEIF